ncbi:glycosyltransferase [Cuniculiplasma sp. SKW4]|uniref:glycosyltransferase n=1 Tax=Cuniculiplasma sp. SKW4 TaxID=3400171 RepID=UPI003FD1271B
MGTYAVSLYRLLKSKYPEVKLIYVGAVEDNLDIYEKIEYLRRNHRFLLRPLTIRKNYRKLVKDGNYGGYLFHYAGTDFSILKKRRGVITIHDLIKDKVFIRANLSPVNFVSALERYRKYLVTKLHYRKALKIITLSQTTQNDVYEKLGVKSVIINQWVDEVRFHKGSVEEGKKSLNLDNDVSYVLAVGNDRKNKRLDLLEGIADSLPPGIKLLKIGSPLKSKGSINVGKVDSTKYPLYFNASICYIHVSDNEGLGIPLLEALGSELPVICRNIPINREILGDAGIYVSEERIIDDAIKEIVSISLNGVSDSLREKIYIRRKSLSKSSASNKYVNLYREVILQNNYDCDEANILETN